MIGNHQYGTIKNAYKTASVRKTFTVVSSVAIEATRRMPRIKSRSTSILRSKMMSFVIVRRDGVVFVLFSEILSLQVTVKVVVAM